MDKAAAEAVRRPKDKTIKNVDQFVADITYRLARSPEELEQCYRLVYEEYLERGYVNEHPSRMRFTLHNCLPETVTFVALYREAVIATATLIPDSPLGLPMDDLYRHELKALRREGLRLCEISMLASNTAVFPPGTSLMLNAKKMFLIFYLFKHIYDYTHHMLDLDAICIAVNPKHNLTYEYLLFEDLGGLKRYAKVNGAPALGKYLRLATVKDRVKAREGAALQKMFLSECVDPSRFTEKVRLTSESLRYFFVEKLPLLQSASQVHIRYIKRCYPDIDFSAIIPTTERIIR